MDYLNEIWSKFLTTKDLIEIAKQDYMEFFHKPETPYDPKLEEKIEKFLETECPIKKKMRKLLEKEEKPYPKKIKDTHLLVLVPENHIHISFHWIDLQNNFASFLNFISFVF